MGQQIVQTIFKLGDIEISAKGLRSMSDYVDRMDSLEETVTVQAFLEMWEEDGIIFKTVSIK